MMVFLVMFGIAMLGLIGIILSHNVFAQSGQDLHDRRFSEVVNQTSSSQQNPQIDVGGIPRAIGVSEAKNTVYVVKNEPNIVSVISGEDNTRIKDIEFGGNSPSDIAVSDHTDTAYVPNFDSDSVSVIDLVNNTKIGADISVEMHPLAVAVDYVSDTVYVANRDSDSVSVIDAKTNKPVIDENTNESLTIPVGSEPEGIGQPEGIAVHSLSHTVYVTGTFDESISVIEIDAKTNKPEINQATDQSLTIPVGSEPEGISVNEDTNTVYVANGFNNSTSVINQATNESLTIPVGDNPVDIAVNEDTNTVYVANAGSSGISVIDGETNEVVTGVTFNVEPFNSGYIVCDERDTNDANTNDTKDLTTTSSPAPLGQYVYVSSDTQCLAKPYEGFEFLSWEQTLEDNSTQLISVSRPAPLLDSIANFMDPDPIAERWDSLFVSTGMQPISQSLGLNPYDPQTATLDVTKFGTFTANFREAPPPLPPEFWAQMYAVIATVITALFIPSIVGWFKSKREAKKLNDFHAEIDALNHDDKLDEKDIKALDDLHNRIENAYPEGKLNEKHYESLSGKISTLYEEIFRKKIAAIDNSSNSNNPVAKKTIQEQLTQVRSEVELAFSKGKINDKHYDLLDKAISKLDGKEGNNNTSKNMR
jgi:YVTN family beta-propeller protein